MPILEHCWFCSLQVASSVVAVYVSIAYLIAFTMEAWWILEIRGQVPYLAYILTTGYLVTFVLSLILVRGVSNRRNSHLILWMCGVLAIIIPEAGLALFMSIQFWKIHTLYGLTEMTSWACRLTVNIAGLVCVQSLYSTWKEEKEVITSLRDLNMTSTINGIRTPADRSRLQNDHFNIAQRGNIKLPSPMPRRISLPHLQGQQLGPLPSQIPPPPGGSNKCEFNASLFDTNFRSSLREKKSKSMLDLTVINQKEENQVPEPILNNNEKQNRLFRSHSISYFPMGEGRLQNGYFAPNWPIPGYILDTKGRVAYIQDPEILLMNIPFYYTNKIPPGSKVSLTESDDAQKYRDVAL